MINSQVQQPTDLIVAGAGPAGMAAAIAAARQGARVLLLEKLPSPGAKLKATGGGRCNLASNLSNAEIMRRFGRDGRFMTPALQACDCSRLIEFMAEIGVECHVPDGMRVFPKDHNAGTVLSALEAEIKRLNIELHCSQTIDALVIEAGIIKGVNCNNKLFLAESVILATGGRGYPTMGSDGSGLKLAATAGHTVTELFPAMLPLQTRETWVKNCRADTIGKAEIRIDLPEAKKLQARGDLIATAKSIAVDVKTDGLSDADIRKAVVVAKLGDAAVKDKAQAYIDARFDIFAEDAAKNADPVRRALQSQDRAPLTNDNGQAAYEQRLADAWKPKKEA